MMRPSAKLRLRAHGSLASESRQRNLPQKGLGHMHDLIAMLLIVAALFTQTLQPGRCFIGQKRRDGRQQLNMAREPGGLLAVEQFGMNTISGLSIQSFFQFQQAGQRFDSVQVKQYHQVTIQRAGVRVVAWMFGQAQQAALDFGKNLSAFGSKSFEIIRTDPCFRPTAEVAINGQIAKGP